MASKIMETVDQFLPQTGRRDLVRSAAYQRTQHALEYFENYVTDANVPDFVGMINAIVTAGVASIPHAALSIDKRSGEELLAISEKGQRHGPVVQVGPMGPCADIGVAVGSYGQHPDPGPVVHICTIGCNRTDWAALSDKGASISVYNMPTNIAQQVLPRFTKVEGADRNNILLMLAASHDETECYPKDTWVNFHREQFQRDGEMLRGVDEKTVNVLRQPGVKIEAYGNIHGYNHVPGWTLELRINRPGVKFDVPRRK